MDFYDTLKPGKRENAFHMEYESIDDEKIGVQSPKNGYFYAYIWDQETNQSIARLVRAKDLTFKDKKTPL